METWRLWAIFFLCILSFPAGLLCGWKIHKYHVGSKEEQKAIAEANAAKTAPPPMKPMTPEEKVNMYERLVATQ